MPATAADKWAEALAEWAIPDEILASAPEPPWGFPVEVFAEGARQALSGGLTPTHLRVAEALPGAGVLLDVGSGAGAASLPVAPPAGRVVAVDQDREMLDAFAALAAGRVPADLVEGPWPDVSPDVGQVDVAVCANVAYNASRLAPFIAALTSVARHRVVLELSAVHPQAALGPLWQRFWGLSRPSRPTAEDAEAVIREVTGAVPGREDWVGRRPLLGEDGPERVARARRRLCLAPSLDGEVAAALEELVPPVPPLMVTLWWPGHAQT